MNLKLRQTVSSTGFLLGLALLCATALRLWGIAFGLPHTEARPDESTVIVITFQLLADKLHPLSLIYPTLFTYLLAAIYTVYALLNGAGGHIYSFLTGTYAAKPSFFFITARLLGAASGIATIIPCYFMGRELKDKTAGLCAAFFMAFCYLHVRDSHFGVLDVPMTLFIAWAAYFALKALRTKTAADYLLCGVFTGLATGTKYAGILLAFQMAAVHLFNLRDEQKPLKYFMTGKRPLFFAAALLAVFFLTTPYLFLDFNKTLEGYRYHSTLHKFMGGSNWLLYIKFSLFEGLGAPLFIAAGAGGILLTVKETRKLLAGFTFAAIYFLVIARTGSTYLRYAVPLLPFACAAAGYLASCARDAKQWGSLWLVIPALIIGQSAARCADFDMLLTMQDTRVTALRYIESLPCPATIYQSASPYTALQIKYSPDYCAYRELEAKNQSSKVRAQLYAAKGAAAKASASCALTPLYDNPSSGGFSDVTGRSADLPDYIVLAQEPFNFSISAKLDDLLREKYTRQAYFEGFAPDQTGNTYDTEDAFFVPFTGFYGIKHPGPNIHVFKRK